MSNQLIVDDQDYTDLADSVHTISDSVEYAMDAYVSILQQATQDAFNDGQVKQNLSAFVSAIGAIRGKDGGQGSISEYLERLERELRAFPVTIDQQDQFLY